MSFSKHLYIFLWIYIKKCNFWVIYSGVVEQACSNLEERTVKIFRKFAIQLLNVAIIKSYVNLQLNEVNNLKTIGIDIQKPPVSQFLLHFAITLKLFVFTISLW